MSEINKKKDISELDLEGSMERLEEVVRGISREGVKLEEALALYEEGVALVRQCNERLECAKRKIAVLKLTPEGELVETPFEEQTAD